MILITRLKEDNAMIKKKLDAFKIKSSAEPLYKIKYLSKQINYEDEKIFIVASKQAIRVIHANVKKGNLKKSIFLVIGKQSSLQLKKIGLKVKLVAQNSNELIKKIKKNKFYKKNKFEYLCANTFNKDFFLKLCKINKNSKRNILYNLVPNKKFSEKTLKLLRQQKITTILFFSKFACHTFFHLCRSNKLNRNKLSGIQFITLSKEIADLQCLKAYKVSWADRPSLASILQKATSTHYI